MTWLKLLSLLLRLVLQVTAMINHFHSIIFFSLILILLILCDKVKEPILVSKVGFVGNGNNEQFPFDYIL